MGSKTKKEQLPFSQQTTYGYQTPPETQAMLDAKKEIDSPQDYFAPDLERQYALAGEDFEDESNSAWNQAVPREARLAMQGRVNRRLAADRGAAMLQADHLAKQRRALGKMDYARLTAPQLVTTGQSGYNTQLIQKPSVWGSILQGAAQVGTALAMGS
jgi:hypothetical protein